jgi:glycosyltransferase involved in cell wall biosynthesis
VAVSKKSGEGMDSAAVQSGTSEKPGVLNISLADYGSPLNETHRKKFEMLSEIARLHVVGFSQDMRFRRVDGPARLDLLPRVPLALFRSVLLSLYALIVGFRLGGSGRIQIVLCQSPHEAHTGFLLRWIMRIRGKHLVLVTELHGDWEEAPFQYRRVPLASRLHRLNSRWGAFMLKRSDVIRVVSSFLERKAATVASSVPRVVFPAFTDYELFSHGQGRDQVSRHDPAIVFIGALYPIKGVSVLLRAMKKIGVSEPSARLNILGDGPLRPRLEAQVAELGLQGKVFFLGRRSQADIVHELRKSRVAVLPSLSEGLGLAAMEAMFCGVPVVASNVGGIPDLVKDGETGFLVAPGDDAALAERLQWMLDHREAADTMGKKGRELVEKNFSARRYVEGYRELFNKAIDLLM